MKNTIRNSLVALLMTGALITASIVFAQSVKEVQTITTSEGTVSEFTPNSIIIRAASGNNSVSYSSSTTTSYVNEAGQPVEVTTIKSGNPVTVYYTRVGDSLMASKVIVRSPGASSNATTTTMSDGTVKEFGNNTIVIKSETSANPLLYSYGATTTYVDETGMPVSIKMVRTGLPVTVYYTKTGNTFVATKVVVKTVPAIPDPVVEEKKTTTTTTTETKK